MGIILFTVLLSTVSATYLPSDPAGIFNTYVSRIDGSELVRMPGESWPVWSPDGKHLILCTNDSVIRVNADGTGREVLFHHEGCRRIRFPRLSPTGKYLAASVLADGRHGTSGGLRIWNLTTRAVVYTDWLYADSAPHGCGSFSYPFAAWHPTRNDLVYTRFLDNAAGEDERSVAFRRARVWTSTPNTPIAVFDLPVPLRHAAWDRSGSLLLFTTPERLWSMSRTGGVQSARKLGLVTAEAWDLIPLANPRDGFWLGSRTQFRRANGERIDPVLPEGSSLLWAGGDGRILVGVPAGDFGTLLDIHQGQLGRTFGTYRRVCGLRTLDAWVAVDPRGERIAWSAFESTIDGWPETGP